MAGTIRLADLASGMETDPNIIYDKTILLNPRGDESAYDQSGKATDRGPVKGGLISVPEGASPVEVDGKYAGYAGPGKSAQDTGAAGSRQGFYNEIVKKIGFDPASYDPYNDARARVEAGYDNKYGRGAWRLIPEYKNNFNRDLAEETQANSAKHQAAIKDATMMMGLWEKDKAAEHNYQTVKEGDLMTDTVTGKTIRNIRNMALSPGQAGFIGGEMVGRNADAPINLDPQDRAYIPATGQMIENPNENPTKAAARVAGAQKAKEDATKADDLVRQNGFMSRIPEEKRAEAGKMTGNDFAGYLSNDDIPAYQNVKKFQDYFRDKHPDISATENYEMATKASWQEHLDNYVYSQPTKEAQQAAFNKLPEAVKSYAMSVMANKTKGAIEKPAAW